MTYKTLKDQIDKWDAFINGDLLLTTLANSSAIIETGMAMPTSNGTFDRQQVTTTLGGVQTIDINGTFSSSTAVKKVV